MKKIIYSVLSLLLVFTLFISTTKVNAASFDLKDESDNVLNYDDYTLSEDISFNGCYEIQNDRKIVIDLNGHTLTLNQHEVFNVKDGCEITISNGTIIFEVPKGGSNYCLVKLYGKSSFTCSNVNFESQSKELSDEYITVPSIVELISPAETIDQTLTFSDCKFEGELNIVSAYYSGGGTTINTKTKASFTKCTFNTIGHRVISFTFDELLFDNCTITNNKGIEINPKSYNSNCFYYNGVPAAGTQDESKHAKVTLKDVTITDTYAFANFSQTSAAYSEYTLEGNCSFGDCLLLDVQGSLPYKSERQDALVIVHDNRENKTKYKVGLTCLLRMDEPGGYSDFPIVQTEKDSLDAIDGITDYSVAQACKTTDDTNGYVTYCFRRLNGIDGKTVKTTSESHDGTTFTWYEFPGTVTYITDETAGLELPFESSKVLAEPTYDKETQTWLMGQYQVEEHNTDSGLFSIVKTGNSVLKVSVTIKGSEMEYLNDIAVYLIGIEDEFKFYSCIHDSKGNYVEQSENEEDLDKNETYTYTYYLFDEGTYCVESDSEKQLTVSNYSISEGIIVENETSDTISFAEQGKEYNCVIEYSYYDEEYVIVSDTIIGTETKSSAKEKSYAWVAIVIAVVVVIGAYVGGFFAFYLKGKAKGKFFDIIYSWFKKLLKM